MNPSATPIPGFSILTQLAYQGRVGCANPSCAQNDAYIETCAGWHCPRCDEPCSRHGHKCEGAT